MQMIDTLITAIAVEMPMAAEEMVAFKELLQLVAVNAQGVQLTISEERWLSMGIHLLSAMRRLANGEKLPAVDELVMEQVSLDMMDLSRKVLDKIHSNDDTEIVLLALHFETAKHSN